MAHLIDGMAIVKNEEEQIQFMLDSFKLIAEFLGVLSIVDNGSSDMTMEIVRDYKEQHHLPIVVRKMPETPHHGELRTAAISVCKSPWIFYLDSDETWTKDMLDWLRSGVYEQADIWDFYKYSTILDRYHYTEGGNGPSTRLFRNVPGVWFPQEIHTHPEGAGIRHKQMAEGPLMFDHTGCKSREALWAKGQRYQWAFQKVVGIGPSNEYIYRIDDAFSKANVVEFPDDIKARIFTGPRRVRP